MTRRTLLSSAAAFAAPASSTPNGVSLAAWSFSGSFRQGKWKLMDMPRILRNQLKIEALEHVNQFFENPMFSYLTKLKKAFSDEGVRSTILMVDGEGNTAGFEKAERKQAAVNHRKWIDIAEYMGCTSVRINVYGGAEDWKQDKDLVDRAAETIQMMLDYARPSGLDIIVENHGRASSDPEILVALVKKVNHPKFGLLCDLGNWNKGDDRYAAVRKTLPFAKGLSVKGTWGPSLDPAFDAEKLVRTALEGGYKGWWGLEVTPRRGAGEQLSADDQFAREVQTVLEAKAIVDRVVLNRT